MMLDSTQEARKVDRKAAAVMWETTVMSGGPKKKKEDPEKSTTNGHDPDFMKFTLLSRKGNKQIVSLALPRVHKRCSLVCFPDERARGSRVCPYCCSYSQRPTSR